MNPSSIASIILAVIVLLTPAASRAQDLDPVSPTSAQDSLLDAGVALYDKGQYDEAIATYASILQANPANVLALAEMSMTYFAKQDYENTVRCSLEGLKYRSKYRPMLYLNLGNAYDMMGKSAEAISAFKNGLEIRPDDYMLHYNLGLALYRSSNLLGAREHFQSAMKAKPTHASSHVALGHVYRAMNKRIPAIFAYSRFLVLEPNSGRSAIAASILRQLLSDSMSVRTTGPGQHTITINPDSDGVDGDLTVLALSLAMTQASRMMKDTVYSSPLGPIVSDVTSFLQITLELMEKDRREGFCWEYYAPYFASIQEKGFTSAFVHVILGSSRKEEAGPPEGTDLEKEKEFKEWSALYEWPD
jgi:tetratricopeptide (TPR) repeat protein